MNLQTQHLSRSLQTLEASIQALTQAEPNSIEFEIYRCAAIKGFELTLEVCGKLLRKALKAYGGSPKEIDALSYKDVFRQSAKHGLFPTELVERWYHYRDNRNNTAHDYGVAFTQETLSLLPAYIQDVQTIITSLNERFSQE